MRTSLYSILCIVVRLGAIILAVQTLVSVPTLWGGVEGGLYDAGTARVLIGFVGAFIALMVVLWIYPGVLARLAAGQASREIFESPIEAAELQYIAFAVAGVVLAVSGLADLLKVGARMIVTLQMTDTTYAFLRAEEVGGAAAVLVKIGLGIGLTFGARGFVGWLRRLREQGLPVVHPDTHEPEFNDPRSQ